MVTNITDSNEYFREQPTSKRGANNPTSCLIKKVTASVIIVFKILRTIVLFPSRYIGSKLRNIKSGYHFSSEKILSPQELKAFMPYAYVNASASNGKYETLKKLGYHLIKPKKVSSGTIESLELQKECLFDPVSGLKALLFEKNNEVIINFGALDSSKKVVKDTKKFNTIRRKGIKSGMQNLLGGVPERYIQADRFVLAIRNSKRLSGKHIILSGNSIGGSLASYVALKQQIPAVCINALALGAGLQQEIGNRALSQADQFITNISIQSDWTSSPFPLSAIDRVVSFLGIRTPGKFGHRYSVPASFGWNFCANHRRVLTSLHNHLKKGERN